MLCLHEPAPSSLLWAKHTHDHTSMMLRDMSNQHASTWWPSIQVPLTLQFWSLESSSPRGKPKGMSITDRVRIPTPSRYCLHLKDKPVSWDSTHDSDDPQKIQKVCNSVTKVMAIYLYTTHLALCHYISYHKEKMKSLITRAYLFISPACHVTSFCRYYLVLDSITHAGYDLDRTGECTSIFS